MLTGCTVCLLTACRFVCGFVSNLLRGRAGRGCRRRGLTPAWRAVSWVALCAISCVVVPDGVAADAVLRRPGGPFRGGFCKQSLAFSSGRGGPPTWLRRPGVPFREWFCWQSLAFSSRRGGHQLRYAGLACSFASGFVRNLLSFPPDGGGGCQLGYAGRACRFVGGIVSHLLRFPPDGGPANLVTLAWRAVSCVVLSAISSLAELFQAHFWCAWGRGTRCTGGAGLGAPGAR